MKVFIASDGHWTLLVRAESAAEAKAKVERVRPDVAIDRLFVTDAGELFPQWDDVIGTEGLEPPYKDGEPLSFEEAWPTFLKYGLVREDEEP